MGMGWYDRNLTGGHNGHIDRLWGPDAVTRRHTTGLPLGPVVFLNAGKHLCARALDGSFTANTVDLFST